MLFGNILIENILTIKRVLFGRDYSGLNDLIIGMVKFNNVHNILSKFIIFIRSISFSYNEKKSYKD